MSVSTKCMGWLSSKMLNKCQFAKESQYRLHKLSAYLEIKKKKLVITSMIRIFHLSKEKQR